MLELSRQGYDVTGLHIDLGIPGSSEIVRGVIERFCGKHGFKLIVKDTIEQGILALQQRKRELADSVVGGEALGSASITRDDVLALLDAGR